MKSRIRGEIVEKLSWPRTDARGTMRVRLETLNQNDVVVMSQIANLMVAVRPRTDGR
ncbi:MAG: hypothetical protein M3R51_06200 [Candidatus Eremiobacteraeota bacterium]|nr:hypothetical protein [Candidatus Eremiobacteraeota bacterium]